MDFVAYHPRESFAPSDFGSGESGKESTFKTSFYKYMFDSDKSPTKQLDALLRAIALYAVSIVQKNKLDVSLLLTS